MSSADPPHRRVVTLAALQWAGGTISGPRVVEQLGVPSPERERAGLGARVETAREHAGPQGRVGARLAD